MAETTDKTRVTDWNAWLGDVPPEPRHIGCGWCGLAAGLPSGVPGVVRRAHCGVYFVAQGGTFDPHNPGQYCAACFAVAQRPFGPCSPGCGIP